MKKTGSWRGVAGCLAVAAILAMRLCAVNPTVGDMNIKVTWVPLFSHGCVALFVTNNGTRTIKVSQYMDCSSREQPGLQQQAAAVQKAAMPDDGPGTIYPAAEFMLKPGAGMSAGGGGALPPPMEIAPGQKRVIPLFYEEVGDAPQNSSEVIFSLKRHGRVMSTTTFVNRGDVWKETRGTEFLHDVEGAKTAAGDNGSSRATKERPWENSLGMKFAPVAGTKALFSVWDTRVEDYTAFINEVAGEMKIFQDLLDETGSDWDKPGFAQSPQDPAVNVSWDDAKAFCNWLTVQERKAGAIGSRQRYRLPTDAEWSLAAGKGKYPWGDEETPPKDAGNFASQGTTAVGSYKPNDSGLYDMGGNVSQWCEDFYHKGVEVAGQHVHDDQGGASFHVVRGSSFELSSLLASAVRWPGDFGSSRTTGFRCVLEGPGKSTGAGGATKEHPWENSLGMRFAPVAGTGALFCIWDTRVQDYEKYRTALAGMVKNYETLLSDTQIARDAYERAKFEEDREWPGPGFKQEATHPAVMVSWFAARAFCEWLTEKERAAGVIAQNQRYRLPADWEWGMASGANPYPWGTKWPPVKGAGNYARTFAVDDYEQTSPVGSFPANEFGLYDMGGNVWQWCASYYRGGIDAIPLPQSKTDEQKQEEQERGENEDRDDVKYCILRGTSWDSTAGDHLELSVRGYDEQAGMARDCGFRCVLATDESTQ